MRTCLSTLKQLVRGSGEHGNLTTCLDTACLHHCRGWQSRRCPGHATDILARALTCLTLVCATCQASGWLSFVFALRGQHPAVVNPGRSLLRATYCAELRQGLSVAFQPSSASSGVLGMLCGPLHKERTVRPEQFVLANLAFTARLWQGKVSAVFLDRVGMAIGKDLQSR